MRDAKEMDDSTGFTLLLDRLKDLHYTSNVGSIVLAIASETRALIERCEEIIENVPREDEQAICDDASEYVEDLLGISFVACQSYISIVVSDIYSLHAVCCSQTPPIILETTSNRKSDILRACSPSVRGGYSEIQVIDAFANYYKHKDEWDWDWDCAPSRSKPTVDIIRSVGASRGNTNNMRTGAQVLGNNDYCNSRAMIEPLEHWGQELYRAYAKELRAKGLLLGA